MLKQKNKEKGITLIVLVVTIIVLIILAGVSIAMLVGENGIITQAQRAKEETEQAERKEESDLDYMEQYVDRIINGNKGLDTITGEEITNSIVYDKYGNKVVVPAGFKIINPEDDVTKGIVIEDVNAGDENTRGSQFVWIPVGRIFIDENSNYKFIELGRYTFDEDGNETLVQSAENYEEEVKLKTAMSGDNYYTELVNTALSDNEKAKDLSQFVNKVKTNKGFYMGRYEAGDATAVDSERETGDTNPVAIKQGIYPYNKVNQLQAANLAKGMYNGGEFDSDLVNSYAWDTTLVFIQEFSGDKDYSIENAAQMDAIAKCGATIDGTNGDVKCNIYDMCGNTQEWSTKTYSGDTGASVYRGSQYNYENGITSHRGSAVREPDYLYISFRVIIY